MESNQQTSECDGLPKPRRHWAIASIWLAGCMAGLDASIVTPALPTIVRDLGVSPTQSVWAVNAYLLAMTAALLPLSAVAGVVGCRPILLGGVGLVLLASIGCALSANIEMLIAMRLVQGCGAGAIVGMTGALLRLTMPAKSLGVVLGYSAMLLAICTTLGPAFSALILTAYPWQFVFLINIPIAAAAVGVGWRALPVDFGAHRDFDFVAAFLSILTICGMIIGLDIALRGEKVALGVALFLIGCAAGMGLVQCAVRQERPLFPIDLLRIASFRHASLTAFLAFAGQTAAMIGLPFHLSNEAHSHVTVAAALSIWAAAVGVSSFAIGRVAHRVSSAVLCAVGLLIMTIGLVSMAWIPHDFVYGPITLGGLGFGLFQSPNNQILLSSAPRARASAASAMLAFSRLSGQTIGAAIAAAALLPGAGPPIAFLVASLLSALAAISSAVPKVFSKGGLSDGCTR